MTIEAFSCMPYNYFIIMICIYIDRTNMVTNTGLNLPQNANLIETDPYGNDHMFYPNYGVKLMIDKSFYTSIVVTSLK